MLVFIYDKGKSIKHKTEPFPQIVFHFHLQLLYQIIFFFSHKPNFFKAKLFFNLGQSVYTSVLQFALFVNLDMLKLTYRFQTLHDDSYNRKTI